MQAPLMSAAKLRREATASDTEIRTELLRRCCRDRGEFYLGEARRYVRLMDFRNALSAVNEGLRSCAGPFYLAVRDELEVLHSQLIPV